MVATEATWPIKPKIFTSRLSQKFANSCPFYPLCLQDNYQIPLGEWGAMENSNAHPLPIGL